MFTTNFKQKRVRRYESNFSLEDRDIFSDCYECWECRMNRFDILHHILGGEFIEAKSIFNAAPLHNQKCHIGKGHHFTKQQENNYLQKTMNFLFREGYKLKPIDKEFILKFKDRYKQILFKV